MPRITFSHANKSAEAEDGEWMYDAVDGLIEDCRARLMARGFPESALHHENFF
jgi:hypothetical protein